MQVLLAKAEQLSQVALESAMRQAQQHELCTANDKAPVITFPVMNGAVGSSLDPLTSFTAQGEGLYMLLYSA